MGKPPLSAEDFYELEGVSDPQICPDGKWIAFVRRSVDRQANAYRDAIWVARAARSATGIRAGLPMADPWRFCPTAAGTSGSCM